MIIGNLLNNLKASYPPLNTFKGSFNPIKGFNVNGSNLAPLASDTVSFTGAKNLNRPLLQAIDNKDECEILSEDAKVAETDLKKVLNNSLGNFVANQKNPHGMIAKISARVKTPESIREKATSEFEDALNNDFSKIFNLKVGEDIKKALGDIVGARVVLRKADSKQAQQIIQALANEVKAGNLKITKIENYTPRGLDDSMRYFKESDLKYLRNTANKHRSAADPTVEYRNIELPSGYMALHIDVDLSNPDYKVKNNGYKGEIQIIGYDVECLKDVEDFCYKVKQGKDVKGGHSAYKSFVEYLEKHLNDPNYPTLKDDFQEYTSRAYLYQRQKEPMQFQRGKKKTHELPTIEQCEMVGLIPPQLDFNNLAKIKENCDNIYSLTTESQSAA